MLSGIPMLSTTDQTRPAASISALCSRTASSGRAVPAGSGSALTMPCAPACLAWSSVTRSLGPNQRRVSIIGSAPVAAGRRRPALGRSRHGGLPHGWLPSSDPDAGAGARIGRRGSSSRDGASAPGRGGRRRMGDGMQQDTWRLRSGELVAEVAALGAELVRLTFRGGTELLWRGDAASWTGQSPILLPVVGRVREGAVRVGAEALPMPPAAACGCATRRPRAGTTRSPSSSASTVASMGRACASRRRSRTRATWPCGRARRQAGQRLDPAGRPAAFRAWRACTIERHALSRGPR